MGNIVTYAQEVLDTFDDKEISAVDSLILSWLSYLHYPDVVFGWRGVKLKDLYKLEYFKDLFHGVWDIESTKALFNALCASPRFRDIRVFGFTENIDIEQEKQFAAICFQLPNKFCYVSFRGTDSTLVGWKEDFNMAFQYPVPSQKEALDYLGKVAKRTRGNLYVGGHSKGGNLAVYAAANASASIKKRIKKVYSHDGPGFLESVLESEAFVSIVPYIDKTLPQSSLVGMLMEQQENFRVIKSNRFSFWQHDPFSWVLEDNDFVCIDSLTPDARFVDRTINEWLQAHTRDQREQFIDSLYSLVDVDGITTMAEFRSDWKKHLPAMAHSLSQMEPEHKAFLADTVKSLVKLGIKNFPEIFGIKAE